MSDSITEEQLITFIRDHYANGSANITPLQALKRSFGHGFKFEDLGFGKWGVWYKKHIELFEDERHAQRINEYTITSTVTEQEVLDDINNFFMKSDMFSHRKHVLGHITKKYKVKSFGKLGFGSFMQFQLKHNLDMGIAKRTDFKNVEEWDKWKTNGLRYIE